MARGFDEPAYKNSLRPSSGRNLLVSPNNGETGRESFVRVRFEPSLNGV